MNNENPFALEPSEEYWAKVNREAPLVAIAKCEEAAKQLITLNSLTTTIYIGIISFSDVIKLPLSSRPALLFILTPLPFWLTSLILATRVIIPRKFEVKQIKDDYKKISSIKHCFLQWSYALLIVSLLALISVITIYLLCVPPPPLA
jgi:hypothetical protein